MVIRELRAAAGIGQADLARKIGLTPTALWKIENGKASPSLRTAKKIANALGCGLDDLGITDTVPPPLVTVEASK